MSQGLTLDDPKYFEQLDHADRDHWWPSAMWRIASMWLDRAIGGQSNLDALDLGCGSGGTLDRLQQRREIHRVVGIEPNLDAIDRARVRRQPLIRASATRLPIESKSFDVVTCLDVFQHLDPGEDRTAALEILRILRPAGVVLVRVNGRGLWPDPASQSSPYSRSRMVRLLHAAGFRIERATYVNGLPAVASEVLGKIRGRSGHPAGGGLTLRTQQNTWLNRGVGWVAGVEARAVGGWGLRLPVGHSTMVLATKPNGVGS